MLNSVQLLSRDWLCYPMDCSTPGFSVHHQLPELAQTHVHWVVMPSNHFILCHPLLLLPLIFPSSRVFSNESALRIRWPKYWSFSFSISPSKEYSGSISFRMDWLDLLQSKGLSRVFSNTTVQKHQFFSAQLSYSPTLTSIMTTGKTIALTRQTFAGNSLCFYICCLGWS